MIKMNEENRLIIKQLNKFGRVLETSELLEMIEQFELSLKSANEMLEIQGRDGNYNYDNYMLGMYNGMEYIISLCEHREPNYRNGKEIEFLNDKQLQNNWNELKKKLERRINSYEERKKLGEGYELTEVMEFSLACAKRVLKDMQELEQGKDENN